MKTAIYAFSGDPITFGHLDIIKRAANIFDKLIVAIGINVSKKYSFSLEERTIMAKSATARLKNVEVVSFEGLLVDFAYENNVSVIIKGVRNQADFNFEAILHQIGDSQKLGIDTHLLIAKPRLFHVSSSMVKALQKDQGLIHDYVPLYVKQCLESKISNQTILGITGEIGVGKSYISEEFVKIGEQNNIEVHHIELDHIGHQILSELKEPKYNSVRLEIINTFSKKITNSNGSINRKKLGEIVFKDKTQLDKLNKIMYTPLLVRLRKELRTKKGLILLNAALIAESDMSYLCNNNVLVIKSDKSVQKKRLHERKLSTAQIKRRLNSQFNSKEKQAKIEQIIRRDKHGKVWKFDNSELDNSKKIEIIFKKIVKDLKV